MLLYNKISQHIYICVYSIVMLLLIMLKDVLINSPNSQGGDFLTDEIVITSCNNMKGSDVIDNKDLGILLPYHNYCSTFLATKNMVLPVSFLLKYRRDI